MTATRRRRISERIRHGLALLGDQIDRAALLARCGDADREALTEALAYVDEHAMPAAGAAIQAQRRRARERGDARPYLSPTQLEMFFRCGEQYRRRYVLGERIPPGVAVLAGSALHGAAQRNYEAKLETREDLPLRKLREAAASAFERKLAEGVALTREEESAAPRVLGEQKDLAVKKLLPAWHRGIAPTVIPALVETPVRVELPHLSHDLFGRIDVVDVDDAVRDLKTSGRRKSAEEAAQSDQLRFYRVAYEVATGRPVSRVVLDVVVKTQRPQIQQLSVEPDARDREVLVARVNAVLRALRSGDFTPAPVGAWNCSPRWCGYWNTCRFVNAERRAAVDSRLDNFSRARLARSLVSGAVGGKPRETLEVRFKES